jgi:hypothetical protein
VVKLQSGREVGLRIDGLEYGATSEAERFFVALPDDSAGKSLAEEGR